MRAAIISQVKKLDSETDRQRTAVCKPDVPVILSGSEKSCLALLAHSAQLGDYAAKPIFRRRLFSSEGSSAQSCIGEDDAANDCGGFGPGNVIAGVEGALCVIPCQNTRLV